MDSVLSRYIEEKHVSQHLLRKLEALEPAAEQAICTLIQSINPSANALAGLFELLEEITIRSGVRLEEILDYKEIREIQSDRSQSRKQRQGSLRRALERLRFPERDRIERELVEIVRELLDVCDLRVVLPKELEGDDVSVTIKARGPEDFREISQKFSVLAEHPLTAKLFGILTGKG